MTTAVGAGFAVEREEALVSEDSLPPGGVEVLLEKVVMSLLRAELLPACLIVLMISGTWKRKKKVITMRCNDFYDCMI